MDRRTGGLRDRWCDEQQTQDKKKGDFTHTVSPVANGFGHTYLVYAGEFGAGTTP